MTWLPKFVVCLSYYHRFRFRSDAFAVLFLAWQIFPLAIAIAVATGVSPIDSSHDGGSFDPVDLCLRFLLDSDPRFPKTFKELGIIGAFRD